MNTKSTFSPNHDQLYQTAETQADYFTAAQVIAILGPCVGQGGYVSMEMGERAPWNALR